MTILSGFIASVSCEYTRGMVFELSCLSQVQSWVDEDSSGKATYMRQLIPSCAATANSKKNEVQHPLSRFGTSTMLFFSQAAECMSGFL